MPQSDNVEGQEDKQPHGIKKPQSIGLWLIAGICFVGVVILTVIALRFRGLDAVPAWVTFLTGGLLNLLLLTVVVFQAQIYHRQLQVMAVAINPRLRIAGVRTVNFGVGGLPVFIVSLVNEGATEARDVEIKLMLQEGDARPVFWTREQSVTIPANGKEEYPIRWPHVLGREDFDRFNNNVPLRVQGFFVHQNTTVDFCYRYYPWPFGRRPDGLPQFYPCGFDPGLTITAKAEVRAFSTVTAKATVVRGNAATETNEDADNKPGNALTDV